MAFTSRAADMRRNRQPPPGAVMVFVYKPAQRLSPKGGKQMTDNLYTLLNNDAKRWWYHRQLREQGQAAEARKRERDSIREHIKVLKTAVFATVGRGGWSIYYVWDYTHSKDHLSKLCGYGDTSEPMIQACIMLDIPVCNSITISDDNIYETIRFPLPAHPENSMLGNPDAYHSLDYAPFSDVFAMYKKIGAEVYNL